MPTSLKPCQHSPQALECCHHCRHCGHHHHHHPPLHWQVVLFRPMIDGLDRASAILPVVSLPLAGFGCWEAFLSAAVACVSCWCLNFGGVNMEHGSFVCKHTPSSGPEILSPPVFLKENWRFYCLLWPAHEPQTLPFPLMHSCLQFDEIFLVRDSFFHLVGEEMGPCMKLGFALRVSLSDQLKSSTHGT